MKTRGVHSISLSVSDIEKALDFYRDYVELGVVVDEELNPEWVRGLWNLPVGTKARRVVLKGDLRDTMLELVEFTPNSGQRIREGAKPWDYGVYCMTFLVKDIEQLYRQLGEKGYRFVTPPIQYQPNWVAWPVKEVTLIADDGVMIDYFMRVKDEEYPTPNNIVRLDHTAWMVDSYDRVKPFFVEVAGLDQGAEMAVPEGLIDDVILLPSGHNIHTCFFSKKDENSLVIECLKVSLEGKPLARLARPPHLGIFQYSFEVDRLETVLEKCREHGFPVLGGPVVIATERQRAVRAATIEGPLGVMFGFFERAE
jgi:catechol 2,3-dioxygenase-like lactoylglutathione lyase family enzyme